MAATSLAEGAGATGAVVAHHTHSLRNGLEATTTAIAGEHATMGQLVAAYLRAGGRVIDAGYTTDTYPDRALSIRVVTEARRGGSGPLNEALRAIEDGLLAVEQAVTAAVASAGAAS